MNKIWIMIAGMLMAAAPMKAQKVSPKMFGDDKLRFYLGITHNNWLEIPDNIDTKPARSLGFEYASFSKVNIIKDRFTFNYGLGLSFVNFHTNVRDFSLDWDTAANNFPSGVLMKDDEYKKNKLAQAFLEIPVEFALKTSERSMSAFKLAIGFKGGWCFDSKTKTKFDDGDKWKVKSFENINRWRYGPTARIGYGPVTLYGFYSLSSTFDNSTYPDFIPYQVGLVFTTF